MRLLNLEDFEAKISASMEKIVVTIIFADLYV
jgi:hypothetical protein